MIKNGYSKNSSQCFSLAWYGIISSQFLSNILKTFNLAVCIECSNSQKPKTKRKSKMASRSLCLSLPTSLYMCVCVCALAHVTCFLNCSFHLEQTPSLHPPPATTTDS